MTSIDIRKRIAAVLHDAWQCGMREREAICAALGAIEPLRERLAEIDDGLDFAAPTQCDGSALENVRFVGGTLSGHVIPIPWGLPRTTSSFEEVYVRHESKPHVMILLELGE